MPAPPAKRRLRDVSDRLDGWRELGLRWRQLQQAARRGQTCPCAQRTMRPPPPFQGPAQLAQGYPLGPRGEPSLRGWRKDRGLSCRPRVADCTAF